MFFNVGKRYGQAIEKLLPERFATADEARAFILKSLQEDIKYNVDTTYSLYDDEDLIETFNKDTSQVQDSTSSSVGSSQSFRPSPLQTTPRPVGFPPATSTSEDEDDNT